MLFITRPFTLNEDICSVRSEMLKSLPLQNTGVIFGISWLSWIPSSCHFFSMIHSDNVNQLPIEKSIMPGVHCHFLVRTLTIKQSKTTPQSQWTPFFLCVLLSFCSQGEIISTKVSVMFLSGYNPKRKKIFFFYYHLVEKY